MIEQPIIYIPDASYDDPDYYPGLDEVEASKRFLSKISAEFKLPAREANIGAGAELPAVAIEVIQYIKGNEAILIGLALFFSGKRINENIDAWLQMGKKLVDAIADGRAIVNRCAALLIGLTKYKSKNEASLKDLHLIQYEELDYREIKTLDDFLIERVDSIKKESLEENLGHTIHYFRLAVDGEEVEMLIRNDMIIEIQKRS